MNPKNAGTLFSSMEELVFFPWYRMHNDSNLYTMREKNSFRNNCVSHTIYECYRNMLFYHSAKLYGTIHNISLLEYGIPFIRLFLLLQKSENTYPSNMRLNGVWFFLMVAIFQAYYSRWPILSKNSMITKAEIRKMPCDFTWIHCKRGLCL